MKFDAARQEREWSSFVYNFGRAPWTSGEKITKRGSTTHTVSVTFCKRKGSSKWELFDWYSSPVYSNATVTFDSKGKITNASGPLTLIRRVGTKKVNGVVRPYVRAAGFACMDARLTKRMQALAIADFVTGLPIPGNYAISVGAWAINKAIPNVPTPRECSTTGNKDMLISVSSSGVASWDSEFIKNGSKAGIWLDQGVVNVKYLREGRRTESYNKKLDWKFTAK